MTPVDRFLERLERVRRSGSGWKAACPAHEDRTPSLMVHEGDDGRVLVCCHRGCSVEEIVAAVGLEMRDLFDRDHGHVRLETCGRPPIQDSQLEEELARARDALTDEHVTRLDELRGWSEAVVRRFGIGLSEKRDRVVIPVLSERAELVGLLHYGPNPASRPEPKTLAAPGTRRDLTPAPEALEIRPDDRLWVVEGEPSALTLLSIGLPAISWPGAGRREVEWVERIARAARRGTGAVVAADCDDQGRDLGRWLVHELERLGVDAIGLDPAAYRDDGFDVGDLVAGWLRVAHDLPDRRETARRVLEEAALAAREHGLELR